MAERSFDDFDEHAGSYRDVHTANLAISGADSFYFAGHKVKQLARYEANSPLHLLDIGCGDGAVDFFMHQHFSNWKIEGIDVSAESIAVATEKSIANANFQQYDGSDMPFADSSFDIVFMAAVLHHIDFSLHAAQVKEVRRVLKPGGRFYLFEHNPLNPVTRHLVNTCSFDRDAKLLSHGYTSKLLKQAGFSSANKKFVLFFPRKGLLSKLIPLEEKLCWLPLGGQYYFRCVK